MGKVWLKWGRETDGAGERGDSYWRNVLRGKASERESGYRIGRKNIRCKVF